MKNLRKMAWVDRPGHLEIRESTLSEPRADEVIIKTAFSAICGSDLHLYRGSHPFVKLPCTIGHELAGYVAAVGSDVTAVKVGDLVVPEPILTCGHCRNCLRGNYHMCREVSYGYRRGQAGFGDYYVCRERWVHSLPPGTDLRAAALTEPLSVVIHGVEKAGDLLGKTVAVLGAGTIGALAAAVCAIKGAGRIFLVDRSPFKLNLAGGASGAEQINANTCSPVETILKQTHGTGCEVVVECTGMQERIVQAAELASQMGTIIQLGISTRPLDGFPYAKILQKELTIRGSQGYCFDFEKAVGLIRSGRISLVRYITGEFPFEQINDAFAAVSTQGANHMKVIIRY